MLRIKFISFFFTQKNEVTNGCALTFLLSSVYLYKHILPKKIPYLTQLGQIWQLIYKIKR